jgi:hypothetical protein
MLENTTMLAGIRALETPVMQGQAFFNNYESLLQEQSAEFTMQLTQCLSALAQSQPELAIELLGKVYTVDGGYNFLFLVDLQLRCFEAVLPALEMHRMVSVCALKLWDALKSDPKSTAALFARYPKVLSSLSWLTELTRQLREPSECVLALSILQQISEPFSDADSLQKDRLLDSLFNHLLTIYQNSKDREESGQEKNHTENHESIVNSDILDTVVHLCSCGITPRVALLAQWLTQFKQDVQLELAPKLMFSVCQAFTYLLASAKMPSEQDATLLVAKLSELMKHNQYAQHLHALLRMLTEKHPQLCVSLLFIAATMNKLSVITLLTICSELSDITIAKHSAVLGNYITSSLLSGCRDEQRAVLVLLQKNSVLLLAVIKALDGQGNWYGETLLSLAFVCGEKNVCKYVFDQDSIVKLQVKLHAMSCFGAPLKIRLGAIKVIGHLASAFTLTQVKALISWLNTMCTATADLNFCSAANAAIKQLEVALMQAQLLTEFSLPLSRMRNKNLVYLIEDLLISDDHMHCSLGIHSLSHLVQDLTPRMAVTIVVLLIDRLKDQIFNDYYLQRLAACGLGHLATAIMPELVEYILATLQSRLQNKSPSICYAVADSLGRVAAVSTPAQMQTVLTMLLEMLEDQFLQTKIIAAQALSHLTFALSPPQVQTIIPLLLICLERLKPLDNEEWQMICSVVIETLGRLVPALTLVQVQTLFPELQARLEEQNADVCQAASVALRLLAHKLTSEQRSALRVAASKEESHSGLALYLPVHQIETKCDRYLSSHDFDRLLTILQNINAVQKDFSQWLQQPESQPLVYSVAENQALVLVDVLFDFSHCRTLREGLPVIVQLMKLGVYHPAQQLFTIALQQPKLNPYYSRALVELVVGNPDLEPMLNLTDEQLLKLMHLVYIEKETPSELRVHIEDWFIDKELQLPPTMLEDCLTRAASNRQSEQVAERLISHTTLKLLAQTDLTDVIKNLVTLAGQAELSVPVPEADNQKTSASMSEVEIKAEKEKRHAIKLAPLKLQCIPVTNLLKFIGSYIAPNQLTADITQIITAKINAAAIKELTAQLQNLPALTLLTYYLDQNKNLEDTKKALLLKILKEKMTAAPLPICGNHLILGGKKVLLPEELQFKIAPASLQRPEDALMLSAPPIQGPA